MEVAGQAADELGYGIAVMHPRGLGWILSRLSLEMYELPRHNDPIRFETWIESNAHMLSTRDFRIYKGDKLIGICKSVWANASWSISSTSRFLRVVWTAKYWICRVYA